MTKRVSVVSDEAWIVETLKDAGLKEIMIVGDAPPALPPIDTPINNRKARRAHQAMKRTQRRPHV